MRDFFAPNFEVMDTDQQLLHFIGEALREDIGDGDHSTRACIDVSASGRAVLKIKEAGVLCGVEMAERIFRFMEPGVRFHSFKKDGDPMQPGEHAFEVEASVHTILSCERVVLNCMQRMCGIATLTRAYSDRLKGFRTRLLDTRKTTPNFRLLEKAAVRAGGGINHRFGLYDMIMLKDNHIDYCGGIEAAIAKTAAYVRDRRPDLRIEVETRSLDDVRRVLACGQGVVFRILLDNFSAADVATAVQLIRGAFETEASGGIRLETIADFARSGVDFVSVGALIHQARSLDLSLKAVVV